MSFFPPRLRYNTEDHKVYHLMLAALGAMLMPMAVALAIGCPREEIGFCGIIGFGIGVCLCLSALFVKPSAGTTAEQLHRVRMWLYGLQCAWLATITELYLQLGQPANLMRLFLIFASLGFMYALMKLVSHWRHLHLGITRAKDARQTTPVHRAT